MDLKLIKQIIEVMKDSEVSDFEIEEKDFKLKLRRASASHHEGMGHLHTVVPAHAAAGAAAPAAHTAGAKAEPEAGMTLIKSPMVGTFYRAAGPDSAPYVSEGSKVTPDTVVCIIEAMKVMNEIQSEVKGTVVDVLIENGSPVEYGQPLFKVKTD